MKTTKKIEVEVNANPMEGITASLYQALRTGTWHWHLMLAKGEEEMHLNDDNAIHDTHQDTFWYNGSAKTLPEAKKQLAAIAGRAYAQRLLRQKLLYETEGLDGKIEF